MTKCCKLIEDIHSIIVEQHLTVKESCKPYIGLNGNVYYNLQTFQYNILDLFYVEINDKLYLEKHFV